jgi:hypothetical protein
MDSAGVAAGQMVFRPYRGLAAAMAVAGLLWAGVFVYLLSFDGVPLVTWLSTAFFIVFFAVSLTYYARSAIVLDARGMTYRGMVRTQRFSFADIRNVHVLPGPVTIYAVRGKDRLVHFTSFFSQHRTLMELLVQRAGLSPQRA